MMPAMIFTSAMVIGIVSEDPDIFFQNWLHIKLLFVLLLISFHFYCGRLGKQAP